MKQIREAIDRMNQCMNRLDRLYYMAARKLGVKDNSLLLYYVLSDEKAHSQKEISEEWLVSRTTLNTVVKEAVEKGYIRLETPGSTREKNIILTENGKIYAENLLCCKPAEQSFCSRGTGPGTDSERIFFRPYERNGGVYGLHAGRISKGDI